MTDRNQMQDNRSGLERFMGDTPLRVAVRLIILSLVVGFVLSAFQLHPLELVQNLFSFVERAFISVFNSLEDFLAYIVLGAVIVVPVWFLLRVMKMRS
ncbi:MAG: DUF6460 domain-containing protein [Hyphomicrobiales bacterium]